jgi:Domain of unknown function (DUF305)
MSDRAKLIAALGASIMVGVVFAASVLAINSPAASDKSLSTARDDTGAIAFCDIASDASEPNFHSEMTQANRRMHEAMEIVPSRDIENDFIRTMIPHHQGAIDMAVALLKYGRDEKLKRLAQSIIVEQSQEIAYMRSLLAAQPGETSAARPIADH